MTNQPSRHPLVDQALQLLRTGNKQDAKKKLMEFVDIDHENADGWFLLGFIADSRQEKIALFQKSLTFNPQHERAKKELQKLEVNSNVQPLQDASQQGMIFNTNRKNIKLGMIGVVITLIVFIGIFGIFVKIRNTEIGIGSPSTAIIPTKIAALALQQSSTALPTKIETPTSAATITELPTSTTLPTAIPVSVLRWEYMTLDYTHLTFNVIYIESGKVSNSTYNYLFSEANKCYSSFDYYSSTPNSMRSCSESTYKGLAYYMNIFGDEQWELAGVTSTVQSDTAITVLKTNLIFKHLAP